MRKLIVIIIPILLVVGTAQEVNRSYSVITEIGVGIKHINPTEIYANPFTLNGITLKNVNIPFIPITSIENDLPFESEVTLSIYDINSPRAALLLKLNQNEGYRNTIGIPKWNMGVFC